MKDYWKNGDQYEPIIVDFTPNTHEDLRVRRGFPLKNSAKPMYIYASDKFDD